MTWRLSGSLSGGSLRSPRIVFDRTTLTLPTISPRRSTVCGRERRPAMAVDLHPRSVWADFVTRYLEDPANWPEVHEYIDRVEAAVRRIREAGDEVTADTDEPQTLPDEPRPAD